MTVSMTGTRVGSLRPAVTASPPVGRRLLASVQMAAPRRRWAACRSSLRDHTDIDSSSKAGKYGKPSIAPGAEGLDDVLERELRSERSRKSLVAAEVEPEQERLGVMATLSFDEAATAPSQLPMAGAVRRIVKSDIVLLLDILGTLLLCACFALDTLPLNEFERDLVHALELDTTFYFTMLYLARWYSKGMALNFILRPLSLVDLVSLMPLFLGDSFRSAAFLRVLRILKIARLLQEEELSQLLALVTGKTVVVRDYQLTLVQAAFTLFSVIFVTAGVIFEMETSAGLDTFNSFFDALYFSITTLTSVGFGDIVPQSAGGKAFVSAAILVYTVLIPYELGLLANSMGLMNSRTDRDPPSAAPPSLTTIKGLTCSACGAKEHQEDAKYCRQCGTSLPTRRRKSKVQTLNGRR